MAILSFSKGHSTLNIISNISRFENQRGISIGKISSGLRIRKAADSVSESAIGSKLRNEVESLKAILTSTASAKSVLEIAEGGLGQISNIITRMTSLALQATNSTNTDDDRAKIDAEFQELKQEITRTAESTNFNTRTILNGGGEPNYIGGGLTGFEKITFKDNADLDTAYTVTKDANGVITIKDNKNATKTQSITYNNDVASGKTVDLNFDELGIVITLNSNYAKVTPIATTANNPVGKIINISGDVGATADAALSFGITSSSTNYLKTTIAGVEYRSDTYDFLNKTPLAKLDTITLKAQDGSNKSITFEPVAGIKSITSTAVATSPTIPTAANTLDDIHLMISPNKNSIFKFQVGTEFSEANFLKVQIESATADNLGLNDSVKLTNPDDIGNVTEILKEANSKIQNIRTKVGVIDNRMDIAIQNIQTTITNSEAAVSAMFDLDIPSEIAELSALEMKQTAAIEALARDIRAKQNLLKLF